MLTHGSLFSGVGGFDLGFQRAGIETIWQVENDAYAVKVLEKHWPNVKRYGDITAIDWNEVERPDIISGGFPCQPVSVAGKRKGQDDERWLWPEFARCLRVLRPRYVVVENVSNLFNQGLSDVLASLAELGYIGEGHPILAAAFGAPHRRERIFFVANDGSERIQRVFQNPIPEFPAFSWCKDVRRVEDLRGRPDVPEPLFRGTRDGIPDWMDRLKCLGNAVVPQITEWLGRRIIELDSRR